MTGTLPADYPDGLSSLLTVPFPPSSVLRDSPHAFRQREMKMEQQLCNKADFVKVGLPKAVEFLVEDPDGSIVIFCNSRAQSMKYLKQFESKLNFAHSKVDVVYINGALNKHEKFWRIRLFCGDDKEHIDGMEFRALLTTNAANVGIDKHSVKMEIRFEFVRDLCTYFQEQGRGSRVPGVPSSYYLFLNLESYVYLKKQILETREDFEVEEDMAPEIVGFNTALTPLKNRAATSAPANGLRKKKKQQPLSGGAKKRLQQRQLRELHEVLSFFCLDNGCQHCLREHYLSSGKYEPVPDDIDTYPPCNTQCPVCTGDWHKQHMPIYKESLIEFFDSSVVAGYLPLSIEEGSISDLLWGNESKKINGNH